jgi:hypothetical protein
MSPQKKTLSISDKELRQVLASLREDVAAPPDFRAKLMQRLQAEGLVQAAPSLAPAQPSLLARLQSLLTPVRLGLAATAALALVLTLRFTPRSEAPLAPGVAPQAAVGQSQPLPVVAQAKPVRKPAAAPAVEMALLGPKTSSSPMPEAILDKTEQAEEGAVGNEPATAPVSSSQGAVAPAVSVASAPSTGAGLPVPGAGGLSIASLDPKPTIVVVEPSPTPAVNPLEGNSQLRGNVIRASRGESAVLLYRVLKAGRVRAEVFDRLGRSITVLKDADETPGVYELKWGGQIDNGSLAPSGIMVLDLQAPGYHTQHKLVLVK